MKIKLVDLLNKREALEKLLEKELPVRASYNLSKSARLIKEELIEFDKVRNELIEKHGSKDEKGNISIPVESEGYKEFLKELEPILQEEIKLKLKTVSMEMLGDDLKIETKYLEQLLDFVITEK